MKLLKIIHGNFEELNKLNTNFKIDTQRIRATIDTTEDKQGKPKDLYHSFSTPRGLRPKPKQTQNGPQFRAINILQFPRR